MQRRLDRDVLRIPVVSGHAVGDQDHGAADRVVMITQAMANLGSDRAGEQRGHRAALNNRIVRRLVADAARSNQRVYHNP